MQKIRRFLVTTLLCLTNTFAATVEERIQSLEDEILELKLKSAVTLPLAWSGEFSTLYHWNDYESQSGTPRKEIFRYTISDFRLNADYTKHTKLRFYSSVVGSYVWNNTFQRPTVITDTTLNNVKGPYLFIDKAYLDYFIIDRKFSLSLGRFPTQYGPPHQFSHAENRKGTYPTILFSIPLDGVSVTANLGKIFDSKERYIFRFIYSPINSRSVFDRSESTGETAALKALSPQTSDAFIVNFEHSQETKWGEFQFIVQSYYLEIERPKSVSNVRGLLQSNLSAGQSDRNIYEVGTTDDKLASLTATVVYSEIKNIFKTPSTYMARLN